MLVHFYAALRPIVGRKTVKMELAPGTTVCDMIDAVVTRFPALREQVLDADGKLYAHIHVFINGRDARLLDGEANVIAPDDTVDIFSTAANRVP